MIFGVGTDIIEVERVKNFISKGKNHYEAFFTEKEIEYCNSQNRSAENFAARYAAKEAFLKAMGTGLRDGYSLKEIEIIKNNLGKPSISVHGKIKEFIKNNNITYIHVSLSHIKNYANAVVILEK